MLIKSWSIWLSFGSFVMFTFFSLGFILFTDIYLKVLDKITFREEPKLKKALRFHVVLIIVWAFLAGANGILAIYGRFTNVFIAAASGGIALLLGLFLIDEVWKKIEAGGVIYYPWK